MPLIAAVSLLRHGQHELQIRDVLGNLLADAVVSQVGGHLGAVLGTTQAQLVVLLALFVVLVSENVAIADHDSVITVRVVHSHGALPHPVYFILSFLHFFLSKSTFLFSRYYVKHAKFSKKLDVHGHDDQLTGMLASQ